MRIRNYTDHQRTALKNLRLPEQFAFTCEQKTAHASERVVFEYTEGDRCDSVILDVDDRSRGYLDAGAAVLVARAHKRYGQQARNPMYTEAARAMSGRAAELLAAWLDTHPSLEVQSWREGEDPARGMRPALAPPPLRPPDGCEATSTGRPGQGPGSRPSQSGPAR